MKAFVPLFVGASTLVALACVGTANLVQANSAQAERPGYQDTPMLPPTATGHWHVHDSARPYPKVVTPGPFVASPAPSDATVLFDGSNLKAWESGGKTPAWKQVGDAMEATSSVGSIKTRANFGDCQLHIEWRTPDLPADGPATPGQARGNSGVFFMDRYEVQVLDTYENPTYADGQAAALYGQFPPMVNACRPAGEWQSYDILFRAPHFEGEECVSPAVVTVIHNGICVHNAVELLGPTAHRSLPKYSPHPDKLPIALQDHGDPVQFRNIWVRELE